MNAANPPAQIDLASSICWGIARGVSVHTLIQPLEFIKIRQQCSLEPQRSHRIAISILRNEGAGAFYRGLQPQLVKTGLKSALWWPMITGFPPVLKGYGINETCQQAATGLAIATVDAIITTPLERARVSSASTGESTFSLRNICRDGWQGLPAYWLRQSVSWTTFLVAQRVFRERNEQKHGSPLTLPRLVEAGVQTALVVSVASAPFDVASNLKLAKGESPFNQITWSSLRRLYRGWPLSALSLTIHNIASVIVIDRLMRMQHQQGEGQPP